MNKLRNAAKSKKPISISLNPRLKSNHHLYLTRQQAGKLGKKKSPTRIKLSKTQLSKNGGFISIPIALGIASAIGSLAGGAATIAKTVNTKKHQSKIEKLLQATKRGKGIKKRGRGAFLPRRRRGRGAFLPRRRKN